MSDFEARLKESMQEHSISLRRSRNGGTPSRKRWGMGAVLTVR